MGFSRQEYWSGVPLPSLNMLSRLVITFLPRSKRLLISWLQSPSASDFGAQENTISIVSLSTCHEVTGQDTMIFVFWMLSYSNIKWKLNFEKCTAWDLWVWVFFGDWLKTIAPPASQRVPSNCSKEGGGCQHVCDLGEGERAIKHISQKSCYSHEPDVSVNDFSAFLSMKRCKKLSSLKFSPENTYLSEGLLNQFPQSPESFILNLCPELPFRVCWRWAIAVAHDPDLVEPGDEGPSLGMKGSTLNLKHTSKYVGAWGQGARGPEF